MNHSFNSTSRKAHQSKQSTSSLSEKIVECWLQQNDTYYQELLIKAKQIELEILQYEAQSKKTAKISLHRKKPLDHLQNELARLTGESLEKKLYLQNYYQFLDNKLKSGPAPINLFLSLENLSKSLDAQFENQKQNLERGIISMKEKEQNLLIQLKSVEEKRRVLNEEYVCLREEKERQKSEEQKMRALRNKTKHEEKQQFQFLLSSVEALKEEKYRLESQQKILKQLLDIEQLHKKHWMMIQNAIKKQFVGRVKSAHYQQAVGMEYKLKMPELESNLSILKMELEGLQSELGERKKRLDETKAIMNNSINRYSQLEGEMMLQSNRRSTT